MFLVVKIMIKNPLAKISHFTIISATLIASGRITGMFQVELTVHLDDFMDDVLEWKTKLNFNPRDLMLEYKFMTECQTLDNLLTFFEENKEYRFGFLFAKPYE